MQKTTRPCAARSHNYKHEIQKRFLSGVVFADMKIAWFGLWVWFVSHGFGSSGMCRLRRCDKKVIS
ncbi:MAG: hypothetical protein ACT6FF_02940 [Methanosarcinaceae archaeon]